jgi:adsorption protein B
MTQAASFIFQYLYVVEILMLIAAVIITISSIDDLFVDALYWSSRLMGTADAKSKELPSVEIVEQLP